MHILEGYKFSDFVQINPVVKLKPNEPYPFIEMKDLNDGQRFVYPSIERTLTGGARFEEGDTLFARITPCLENGKICQAKGLKEGKGFGSTEFLVFRNKKGLSDADFVFYLSRWDEVRRFAELNLVGTSGRQRVPKDVFDNLEINVPSLPSQRKIASILSSLDDKIELNRRMNQTLEQMASTLFKKYFVDDIYSDYLPEGWTRVILKDFIKTTTGYSYKSSELKPSKKALVTLKNFDRNGGFKLNGFKEYLGGCKESQIVIEGDLAVAHTDVTQNAELIGNPILIINPFAYEQLVISTDLVKVDIINHHLTEIYLYYLMLDSEFKNHCLGYTNGTTVLHLSKSGVGNYTFNLPPVSLINKFTKQGVVIRQLINNNIKENISLQKTRDLLLPKLMSGNIDLSNLQQNESLHEAVLS